MDPTHRRFLAALLGTSGERLLCSGAEDKDGIKQLAHDGYIRLVPALCGPLGVRTGEFFAQITDAGRVAYEATLPPDLRQS